MSLSGKTALITGSTSGIGLGVAKGLAAAGANVMLNGFGEADAIEAERAGLEKEDGGKSRFNGADLTKPAEIEALIRACDELGGVDIIVNNAGIQHVAPVEDFPPEKWDAIIALNLTAAFDACRLAVPHMKARGWGRIISTASAHSLAASPFKVAYVAAKHGIAGLTKTLGVELARNPFLAELRAEAGSAGGKAAAARPEDLAFGDGAP